MSEETTVSAVTPASSKRWYVVHAYSGMEKAVERNLRERIDRAGMQDKFGRILVPMEEVVELKNGKKAVTERRFFPGYVLVEMDMADDTWHLVKHTSKVTGFVGGARNRPAPISDAEVMKIVNQMQEGIDKPRPKVEWVVGELRTDAFSGSARSEDRPGIFSFAWAGWGRWSDSRDRKSTR